MNMHRKGILSPPCRGMLGAGAMLIALGACENPQEPDPPGGPTPLRGVHRDWVIEALMNDEELDSIVDVGSDHTAQPMLIVAELGTLVKSLPVWAPDTVAKAEIFSNETGETFWLGVQAPAPHGLTAPDSVVGADIHYQQSWRFRKDSPDAWFNLLVTSVYLEAYDGNGLGPSPGQCSWGQLANSSEYVQVCRNLMRGKVDAWYWARPDVPTGSGSGPPPPTFFSRSGTAIIAGWGNSFRRDVSTSSVAAMSLFDLADFELDPVGPDRHQMMELRYPILVPIPLDSIDVGEAFEVGTSVTARVWNRRQGESYLGVYFRDPAGSGGLSIDFEGVTMLDPPAEYREPLGGVSAAPPCAVSGSGGNGGIIQLATNRYLWPEWRGEQAEIEVTRTGGGEGAASVTFRTIAGSATPGTDYEEQTSIVRFDDGEEGIRVVHLDVRHDTVTEPNETVGVTISDAAGCASLGSVTTGELVIMDDDQPLPDDSHTIGGTVDGLEATGLVLTNNSTDDLQITADGPFKFAREYANGFIYNVRVDTQPGDPAQLCTVTNGSGTVDGADVSDIEVHCETLPPATGHLDPAFGTGGKVTLPVNYTGVQGDAPDLALQADGRIVVVSGNTVARYNPDGTLDGSFGAGGRVTLDVYGARDRLNAVAVQPDGRIVVAGYSQDGVNSPVQEDFIVARYEGDGTLDASFGSGGYVVTDFEEHQDIAYDLVIQPDGGIVLVGLAGTIDDGGFGVYYPDFAAARFTSDGTLDATFGTGGKVTTNIAGRTDLGYGVALQPDGRIVLAGRVAPTGASNPDIGIVRYNADGSLDTDFGEGGILRDQTALWDEAADVLVQPDGRIVVVGFTLHEGGIVNPAPDTLTVARYNPDGSYDATFGDGGRIQTALMVPGRGVVLQPDGAIVVAGVDQSGASADYAVARFTPAGDLDTTFGTDGRVTVDFFGDVDIGNAVVVQPDGKVVVVGAVRNGTHTDLGLIRVVP